MKNPINYIVCCLIVLFITSCGTQKIESGTKQLELGMTKQEVINLLGKNYSNIGAAVTPEGNMETWQYSEGGVVTYVQVLTIHFLNGRIVEWFKDTLRPAPQQTINVKTESE